MEKHQLIQTAAAAIRSLMRSAGLSVSVSYREALCQVKDGCIRLEAIPAGDDSDAVLKRLVKSISVSESIRCVCIEGLGCFEIHRLASPQGRAADKIAIITGAAQGIGLEIAQDLARQGAYVAMADINQPAAAAEAEKLCRQYGKDRAIPVAMNVVNKESVHQAVGEVVKTWGGVDVFISNAGVLKAESVKTQSEKDFEFVTDVNYKGYFLCVQAVAPIMAIQHQLNPAVMSDIIQINSKSGLTGSNKNGAYAGSKFGSIGLTQSFALELIEDGIKVNSICPGNFFDGPLWSDPNNGLFVQYLRTGKVPGARTLEEVKTFYENKVPMKRGCRAADVMAAIYYLIDQQYETGQALPVTGGQIMLH